MALWYLKDIILWNIGKSEKDINVKRIVSLIRFVDLDCIQNALKELMDEGKLIIYKKGSSDYITMPNEKKELFRKDHNFHQEEMIALKGAIDKITG